MLFQLVMSFLIMLLCTPFAKITPIKTFFQGFSETMWVIQKFLWNDIQNTQTGTSSRPEVFCKKGVLRNFAKFTGKYLCQSLFFIKVAGWSRLIKRDTVAQVFSCEFCKISRNTFSYRTPPVVASETGIQNYVLCQWRIWTWKWI